MTEKTLMEAIAIKRDLDLLYNEIALLKKAANRFTEPCKDRVYEMDSIINGIHEGRVIISADTAAKAMEDEIRLKKNKRSALMSELARL